MSIQVWISRRRQREHRPMRTGLGAAPEETNRHQLRVPTPAIAAASSALRSSGGETNSPDLVMALPLNRKHLWAPRGVLSCSWARWGRFRHRLGKIFLGWIEFVDQMPLSCAISLCRERVCQKWDGSRKNRKSTPASRRCRPLAPPSRPFDAASPVWLNARWKSFGGGTGAESRGCGAAASVTTCRNGSGERGFVTVSAVAACRGR